VRKGFSLESFVKRSLKKNTSLYVGFLSVTYGLLSVAMVLTNKLILGRTKSSQTATLLVLIYQCTIVSLLLLVSSFIWKDITLRIDFRDFGLICVVNLSFIGTIVANSNTLRHLSIHMVTLLKNVAVVFTVLGDRLWLHHSLSLMCWAAVGLIVIGSSCGMATDVEFSPVGYFWMGLSCAFASLYVLLTKKLLSSRNIHYFTILFWNNSLSIVLLAAIAVANNAAEVAKCVAIRRLPFGLSAPLVAFSGVLGLALSVSTFSLLGFTSATSYVVVGTANKVAQAILSFVLFRVSVTLRNGISVGIGLTGASLYAYVKWREQAGTEDEERGPDALLADTRSLPAEL
jgi:GDP-mannose transporter